MTYREAMPEHEPNYVHSSYLDNVLPTENLRKTLDRAERCLLKFDFDAIAFRGMSGALVAIPLALRMNKSLIMVRKPNDGSHSAKSVEGDAAARRYIIADEVIFTGDTVRAVFDGVKQFAPEAECLGVMEADRLPLPDDDCMVRWYKLSEVPGRSDVHPAILARVLDVACMATFYADSLPAREPEPFNAVAFVIPAVGC